MIAGLMATGCHDQGQEEPHPATLYDLVDVASVDASGHVKLHLYGGDADVPQVMTGQLPADGRQLPAAGTSILLAYQPLGGGETTPIAIESWSRINNSAVVVPDEDSQEKNKDVLSGWNTDPVGLRAVWRGGRKIYMRMLLPYDSTPRRFALVQDPATAGCAVADLYLYHRRKGQGSTFDRQYYAAFDLSPLLEQPGVESVRVFIANNDATSTVGSSEVIFSFPLARSAEMPGAR